MRSRKEPEISIQHNEAPDAGFARWSSKSPVGLGFIAHTNWNQPDNHFFGPHVKY